MNSNLRRLLARGGDKKAIREEKEEKFYQEAEKRREIALRNRRKASRLNLYKLPEKIRRDKQAEMKYRSQVSKLNLFSKGKPTDKTELKMLREKIKILQLRKRLAKLQERKTAVQNFNNARINQLRQAQAKQNYYNWIFSDWRASGSQFNKATEVENEIMSFNGFANEGNLQAFSVDKMALGYKTGSVDLEALNIAKFQIFPINKLSIEADMLSRIIP